MDLREVAKLVAEALELRIFFSCDGKLLWYDRQDKTGLLELNAEGQNISSDYWRCRCEEWLHDQDYRILLGDGDYHEAEHAEREWMPTVICPLAEAPARLVAEVWKRMKEQSNG